MMPRRLCCERGAVSLDLQSPSAWIGPGLFPTVKESICRREKKKLKEEAYIPLAVYKRLAAEWKEEKGPSS